MQPKVSIVMPIYNAEPYLRQCMDSVIGQTLQEIEIVCVNDGSKDNSLSIMKEYAEKDPRIVIVDKENGGYGMAMNIGMSKATGEYVGIVEPDDYVAEDMYESLYKAAKEHDLDLVKSDFTRFVTDKKSGGYVYTLSKLSKNPEDYNRVFDPSTDPQKLRIKMNTWTGIYKRAFLEENGVIYNETPGASFQDNAFWFQTFYFAKRAMILDKSFYNYRIDNPNSSINNKSKIFAINNEYDFIKNILVKYPEKWDLFKGMFWHVKYHNYSATLTRIHGKYKREFIDRISAEFRFAYERQEFTKETFDKWDWRRVSHLMRTPLSFYIFELLKGSTMYHDLKKVFGK